MPTIVCTVRSGTLEPALEEACVNDTPDGVVFRLCIATIRFHEAMPAVWLVSAAVHLLESLGGVHAPTLYLALVFLGKNDTFVPQLSESPPAVPLKSTFLLKR